MNAVHSKENIRKNKIGNTRTSFENSIMNDSLCAFRFTFEMSKETTEKICLQDELPIVLITTMELKTFIKGYHVYQGVSRLSRGITFIKGYHVYQGVSRLSRGITFIKGYHVYQGVSRLSRGITFIKGYHVYQGVSRLSRGITFIKGYHVYKDTWIPKEGEQFEVFMEPDKKIVGHLKKGATGRFAKTIFFFLPSDPYSNSSVQITGKRCNLGDGEGMQVPCRLSLSGQAKYMKSLNQELTKMKEIKKCC